LGNEVCTHKPNLLEKIQNRHDQEGDMAKHIKDFLEDKAFSELF